MRFQSASIGFQRFFHRWFGWTGFKKKYIYLNNLSYGPELFGFYWSWSKGRAVNGSGWGNRLGFGHSPTPYHPIKLIVLFFCYPLHSCPLPVHPLHLAPFAIDARLGQWGPLSLGKWIRRGSAALLGFFFYWVSTGPGLWPNEDGPGAEPHARRMTQSNRRLRLFSKLFRGSFFFLISSALSLFFSYWMGKKGENASRKRWEIELTKEEEEENRETDGPAEEEEEEEEEEGSRKEDTDERRVTNGHHRAAPSLFTEKTKKKIKRTEEKEKCGKKKREGPLINWMVPLDGGSRVGYLVLRQLRYFTEVSPVANDLIGFLSGVFFFFATGRNLIAVGKREREGGGRLVNETVSLARNGSRPARQIALLVSALRLGGRAPRTKTTIKACARPGRNGEKISKRNWVQISRKLLPPPPPNPLQSSECGCETSATAAECRLCSLLRTERNGESKCLRRVADGACWRCDAAPFIFCQDLLNSIKTKMNQAERKLGRSDAEQRGPSRNKHCREKRGEEWRRNETKSLRLSVSTKIKLPAKIDTHIVKPTKYSKNKVKPSMVMEKVRLNKRVLGRKPRKNILSPWKTQETQTKSFKT